MVLPLLLIGGAMLLGGGALGLIFNKQQVAKKQEETKQAQIDVNRINLLSKVSPQQAVASTASIFDDWALAIQNLAPYILIGVGVVAGSIIILKK